ncbi:protein FAM131A isoform X3 [Prionailurus bengalensis]|uniref:Protein FAM131A isoform X3 n=1 Tax=Acinonyx jubatus TaxID=32536 RepID=A0A6J1ZI99_ACIJB|nr:protein FAM131A isoform X3 [Felis catus]XP_026917101.1 protein FAM131A isoform X3 [Acinonyx jubatus]XP_043450674.1 protein FAM131A isoform X3 [Prionailurus bengalensis]
MPMISVLGKMFLWQREGPGGRWTCQTSRRVASDPAWAVEWIELPRGLSLSSLGSARTLRGWSRSSRPSSVDSQDLPEVNVGDTVAMLPKSRRALTIQEIAALARSSLHGVAEQFAIAEAKLRAWSSVDGEDSTDESYDEDYPGGTDSDMAGQLPLGPHLQDLFTGHRFSRPMRQGSVEPESDCSQTVSPETLCSSLCSLEDGLLGSPARLASQLLGDELLLAKLPPSRESAFRSLGPLEAQDSLYNSPLMESCLSPAEEEPAPCKDCQPLCPPPVGSWERQRQASDVASSGVVSLDADEAEPEEQ